MPTISTARGRIRIRIAKWTLGGRWDCIMRKRKKKNIHEPHYRDYWDLFWKERVYKKNQTSMFQLVLNIATLGQCHSTNRRQHVLGPGRQEAGLFHLPVGPVAQDPVGLLPLPPLPTPRWISQPQTTSRLARASSARGQGSLREGGGQAQSPGLQRRRWGLGRTHGVDLDRVVLPTAQAHAAEPCSAAAPTAGPPSQSSEGRPRWPPVAPASPALFHHNPLYPTRWGPALSLSGLPIAVQGSWSQ